MGTQDSRLAVTRFHFQTQAAMKITSAPVEIGPGFPSDQLPMKQIRITAPVKLASSRFERFALER
jgi:hypothetical protein